MLNTKRYSPDYSSIINEGGFGDVYRCKENSNLVVKLAKKLEKQYNGECDRRIVKKLFQHENLMHIFGIDKHKYGDIYLIYMENISGICLSDYANRYIVNDDVILICLKQILSALEFLHSNKITHRDIKLDNIMIDPDTYKIKVIDFGLSCYGYPCKNIVGTSGFFAPEMIYSTYSYNSLCDIWSLGCVLYYLVCKYYPFYFNYDRECYIRKLKEKTLVEYSPNKWQNELLYVLCSNMLVYDNNDRFSAKKLLQMLEEGAS